MERRRGRKFLLTEKNRVAGLKQRPSGREKVSSASTDGKAAWYWEKRGGEKRDHDSEFRLSLKELVVCET